MATDESDRIDTDEQYFTRVAVPTKAASEPRKAALARAHELRKFEIENYWKRSSYFWGFQLVAFAALALSAKDGRFNPQITILVALLGALAALTGLLSAKGSKFWQANWEAHVDFLENEVEGKLHTTALIEDDVSYSVSRVNERFLELLLIGWVGAFAAAALTIACPVLSALDPPTAAAIQIGVPAFALVAGAMRLTLGTRSRLRGRAYHRRSMKEWTGR